MLDARRTPIVGVTLALLLLCGSALRAEEARPEATPAFWLAKAETLTQRMPHPEGRAALLVSIGTGWVEAGELERARPLLASAAKHGKACRSCISKARRLAEVALLQHQAGDEMGAGDTFESARKACDEVDGARRVQALAYLAQQRQAAGERMLARHLFVEANEAADALEGVEQAEGLAAIADAEIAAGNRDEARLALKRVEKATSQLRFDGRVIRDATLLTAAAADLAAGRLTDAHLLVMNLHAFPLKVSGYASLARAAFDAGETEVAVKALEQALTIAGQISDPIERADAMAETARAAWAAGQREQGGRAEAALGEAADEIEDPEARFAAKVDWVHGLRVAGDDAQLGKGIVGLAALLAEPEPDVDDAMRDRMRMLLVNLMARVGARTEARQQVKQITDPVRQARAWLDLAEHALTAGEAEQALAATRYMLKRIATWGAERRGDTGELMRRAAVLQAASGAPEDALKTVDAIAAPFHAATACTYIARDLT